MSGSRLGSHQLSNGLVVSGRPEQFVKERLPTMASRAVPYTGGDVRKSGELGKMCGINPTNADHHHQGPPPLLKTTSRQSSGSVVRSGPNSGQMGLKKSSSGPLTPIQPTGLIYSGPLGSNVILRSGQLERTVSTSTPTSTKPVYGSAVTALTEDVKIRFGVSSTVIWVLSVVVFIGFMVGAFLTLAVKEPMILIVMVALLVPVFIIVPWNFVYKKCGLLGFLRRYPAAELRGAVDGQFVKVTGVVTCGSIPLESSFQRVPRCVYVSTELHEYRTWGGKSANPKHHYFSWGCRYSEKYAADFYISDFQTGLRAQVKVGHGAKIAPLIKPTTVVDITMDNKELSPNFQRWLADRSLSSDDRIMCLKEGYIKEGSTISVMGVLRQHANVVMIVPPAEPVSTGCQWTRCLLPTYVEGLVLLSDKNQDEDVIPV